MWGSAPSPPDGLDEGVERDKELGVVSGPGAAAALRPGSCTCHRHGSSVTQRVPC